MSKEGKRLMQQQTGARYQKRLWQQPNVLEAYRLRIVLH